MSQGEAPAAERVLCDTSFVSVLESSPATPDVRARWPEDVRERLGRAILGISVVSLAELRSGHINAGWGSDRIGRAEARIATYVWVPIDMEVVDRCAALRAAKLKNGWGVGDNDLWIAATAQAREQPLVACDLHFCEVDGLDLIYLPGKADARLDCP